MERKVERISKYNLSGAVEDTYASKTAQNPTTSRRVKSLIPTPAGYLEREQPNPTFATNALPSGIVWAFEFDQSVSGSVVRYYFVATLTVLYMLNGAPGTGSWVAVAEVGILNGIPDACSINNLMHFSDGVNSFIFDGTNWVVDGMPIPQSPPHIESAGPPAGAAALTSISRLNGVVTAIWNSSFVPGPGAYVTVTGVSNNSFNTTAKLLTVSAGGFPVTATWAQPGFPDAIAIVSSGTVILTNFTVTSTRYYWTSFSDQSDTHPHESTSSPRNIGTGPLTNAIVLLLPRVGRVNSASSASPIVIGLATDWNAGDIGLTLQVNGNVLGIVASVEDAQHLTLTQNSPLTVPSSNNNFTLAPARATHFNFYCSETENSAVGFFLGSVKISDIANGGLFIDQSPFANVSSSYIDISLQRPTRNDPTTGSKIITVHKRRIFRRNEKLPNFFNYTAFEEVKAGGNGTAEESVPGHDPNTLSDIVNEQSYPEQSRIITAMVDHADALFIGTERSVIPLFGETIDDFVLSQVTAFSVGMGGRFAVKATPHGLCFLSYDRKVYLWPQQWIPFYAPEETTTLIELSRPKRTTFQNINPAAMDETWIEFFNYGKRNWMVISFQDNLPTGSSVPVSLLNTAQAGSGNGTAVTTPIVTPNGTNYAIFAFTGNNIFDPAIEQHFNAPWAEIYGPLHVTGAQLATGPVAGSATLVESDSWASVIALLNTDTEPPIVQAFNTTLPGGSTWTTIPDTVMTPFTGGNTVIVSMAFATKLSNSGHVPSGCIPSINGVPATLLARSISPDSNAEVSLWAFYNVQDGATTVKISGPNAALFNDPSNGHGIFAGFSITEFDLKTTSDGVITTGSTPAPTGNWHTYVFDFEVKGWFELQRGVQSLAVFEPSSGVRVLVGGGTDGFLYVLDDPTGFFSTTDISYPPATFRPALIDYGQPDMKHINRYLEFEVSDAALVNDITVNYYLDPIDVDNPGTPIQLTMTKVLGANRWRGFFTNAALCERILIEFLVAASQNNGNILSITLAATPASKLVG